MLSRELSHQTGFYSGKVRDVYYIGNDFLFLHASDRISAFDVILPKTIPFKGQVLNQLAAYMLQQTKDICPNWLLETPAPQVSFGYRCQPFKIEVVVRATLTGHAWRTYKSGLRTLCGVVIPEGMKENEFFPQPIITPSTKASEGHDEDISESEILNQGLATAEQWEQIKNYAFALFAKGQSLAKAQGLILADTKYEFGLKNGEIYLMDEIHTPDSSRYFYAQDFETKVSSGIAPEQLSKEFVRAWLMEEGFMGKEGQKVPTMTDEIVNNISSRYIHLYEQVTGLKFEPQPINEEYILQQMEGCIHKYLK